MKRNTIFSFPAGSMIAPRENWDTFHSIVMHGYGLVTVECKLYICKICGLWSRVGSDQLQFSEKDVTTIHDYISVSCKRAAVGKRSTIHWYQHGSFIQLWSVSNSTLWLFMIYMRYSEPLLSTTRTCGIEPNISANAFVHYVSTDWPSWCHQSPCAQSPWLGRLSQTWTL